MLFLQLCQDIILGGNQLLISRSKLSIFCCIFNVFAFLSSVLLAVLGLIYSMQRAAYIILLCLLGIPFLFLVHKSCFVRLTKSEIKYRKYFIPKEKIYADVPILFITKHVFETKGGVLEFHNKRKEITGCIFFMKDITLSAKKALSNSYYLNSVLEDEWTNIYIDVAYRKKILEIVLQGGFRGRFYITNEMYAILGNEIEGLLKEYNPQINLEIIDIMQN